MSETYPNPDEIRAEATGSTVAKTVEEGAAKAVSLVDFLKSHPADLELVKQYVADLPSPAQVWLARYRKFAVALAGTVLTALVFVQALVPVVGQGLPSSVSTGIAAVIALLTALGVRQATNRELDPAVPAR